MIQTTPIYHLYDDVNQLYIKRDDLIPFSFGGNKVRKALYFFDEIDKGDYDCVVTYGSSSSNHCRVISNMAAARKLPCYIIQPEESSIETFNSKMMNLFGAEITIVPVQEVSKAIETKLDSLRQSGKKPYFIAGGGHGNLGTKAYVDCYKEIKEYEDKNDIFFDYIFLASGTGTTQAGLIAGQLIENDVRKIIGISIARKKERGTQIIVESVRNYLGDRDDIDENTIFLDEYIGNGYASNNPEINKIIIEILTNYGVPLDSTYTGKAFYGMHKYLEKNSIRNKRVLFIHTGGTPLFFDDMEGDLIDEYFDFKRRDKK